MSTLGRLDTRLRVQRKASWSELTPDGLGALLLLDSLPFFGPQKFREIYEQGLTPEQLVADPARIGLIGGKRGPGFAERLADAAKTDYRASTERARRLLGQAARLHARVLSYGDDLYPPVLYHSNYPVPVLYARGAVDILAFELTVACVGSRKIRKPYAVLHKEFARFAVTRGYTVVSGFALGADSLGHRAAVEAGGNTIAVMAGGLDRPFPPENRGLWQEFLSSGRAVFVSEVGFGARTSALTLRRRNKLIVGLSRGVLVSQSATTGGAMNAYRFAAEDHKPVATFEPDGKADTSGNELIRSDRKAGAVAFELSANSELFPPWLDALAS